MDVMKPKPNSIARPDVIVNQEFMTPEMFQSLRPKETLNIDRLPFGKMSLEDFRPRQEVNDKFPQYVN